MSARVKRTAAVSIATVAASAGLATAAQAAPGDLVSGYGTGGDGETRTNVSQAPLDADGPIGALAPDGKMVAAAATEGGNIAIFRYLATGQPDTTFSGDGRVTVDAGGSDEAASVAVQPDGKIVVAGTSSVRASGVTRNFSRTYGVVVRVEADGDVDPAFNGGNPVRADVPPIPGDEESGSASFQGVAIQPDGKIVLAGYAGTFREFFLYNSMFAARLNADGSFDTGFSGDGKREIRFEESGASIPSEASAVAVGSGGKVILAGKALPDFGEGDFAVAQLTSSGDLDTAFSGDGRMTANITGEDYARSLAIQTDGKIVAAGIADGFGVNGGVLGLARFSAAGALDTTFSGDGKQTHATGEGRSLAVQTDGKVVVGGSAGDNDVLRFLGNGTFETANAVAEADPQAAFFGSTASLATDGSIYVTGTRAANEGFQVGIARFSSAVQPVSSYGTGGVARQAAIGPSVDKSNASVLQPDGKMVVVGSTTATTQRQTDTVVARYGTDGQLDTTFGGGDGIATINTGPIENGTDVALSGTKIVVSVDNEIGSPSAVAQFTDAGALDTTFSSGDGTNGYYTTSAARLKSVTTQTDGKIVAAGDAGGQTFTVRLGTTGAPDSTYSGDGVQITNASQVNTGQSFFNYANEVAIDSSNRILVAGIAAGNAGGGLDQYRMTVIRYQSNGNLDTSFAGDGVASPDQYAGGEAQAIELQTDGKVLVGGTAGFSPMLGRLNTNGTVDTAFGGDGTPDFGAGISIEDLAIAPSGHIYAAGGGTGSNYNFAVARLSSAGTPDPTFASHGTPGVVDVPTPFLGGASGIALSGSSILATGTLDSDLAITKLDGSTPAARTLTVNGTGFSGTVNGPGIECFVPSNDSDDCSQVFADGKTVTLNATPDQASTFLGWSGACSGTGACQITMNSDKTVTANFGDPQKIVSVNVVGNGKVTGEGIDCPPDCLGAFGEGETVFLEADADPGFKFQGWSGACSGSSTGCDFEANADKTVTATFVAIGPPDTQITDAKITAKKGKATFTLKGTGDGAPFDFECSLDGAEFTACNSPVSYKRLKKGTHTFAARAVGSTGLVDASPATKTFKSKRR